MKSNIEKTQNPCPSCGTDDSRPVASGHDMEHRTTTDDEFHAVQCLSCGLFYLHPRPADSELSTIYPDDYQSYTLSNPEKGKAGFSTRLRHWIYSFRLKKGLKGIPLEGGVQILDVGCSDGWMLDCFKSIAPEKIQTFGVELNPKAAEIARQKGHQVFTGRMEEVDFRGQQFDMILMSHVIEHLADPGEALVKLRSLLKEGGRIVVETPNIQSVDGKLFRSGAWGGYHFPRHWVFFGPRTLEQLARKSGLRIEKFHFHATPVFWHWTMHNFFGRSRRLRWLAPLFEPRIIFQGGPRTLLYLGVFTFVDRLILLFRIPTSNMMALMRKIP